MFLFHLTWGPGARHASKDWQLGAAALGTTIVFKGLKIKACHFKTSSFYTMLRRPFRVLHKMSYTF